MNCLCRTFWFGLLATSISSHSSVVGQVVTTTPSSSSSSSSSTTTTPIVEVAGGDERFKENITFLPPPSLPPLPPPPSPAAPSTSGGTGVGGGGNGNPDASAALTALPSGSVPARVTEIDPCKNSSASSVCVQNAVCVDTVGGLPNYTCQCQPGYTGNGFSSCSEINECLPGLNNCDPHAYCTNSIGSYACTCSTGYAGNGQSCYLSVMQLCTNTSCIHGTCYFSLSSYTCLCSPGWNGPNCNQTINQCAQNSSLCSVSNSICINTPGSYYCRCANGFYGDATVKCIQDILYPHGLQNTTLPKTKDSTILIDVIGGLPFFGQMYYEIQISSNGYITLGQTVSNRPLPTVTRPQFLPNVSMIAPYWSDIDITFQGNNNNNTSTVDVDVYNFWNMTPSMLSVNPVYVNIVNQIPSYTSYNFMPTYALVVTWNNAVPYPAVLYAGVENATFQVVLTTDSSQSFAMVNYAGGRMLWNPLSDNRTIVIGITDGGSNLLNYSTTPSDLYRPDLISNVGLPGRVVFMLGAPQHNTHLPCIMWYAEQNNSVISTVASGTISCPCTLEQAISDQRFNQYSMTNMTTMMGQGPCYSYQLPSSANVEICCYDSVRHALIVGQGSGSGYLQMTNDTTNGMKHCCQDTNLCHLYYNQRPSDDCLNYVSPSNISGPPFFASGMPAYIAVTVGIQFKLHLNATDPSGGPISFNVDTNINNTEWQIVNGNNFMWKPMSSSYDVQKVYLRFFAINNRNVSRMYWPIVQLCPCSNNSRCSFDYFMKMDHIDVPGRIFIAECLCQVGWTGPLCNQPQDLCHPSPCYPGVTCVRNLTAFSTGFQCGSCPAGLLRDGNRCYSPNQCLNTNVIGSSCLNCTNLMATGYRCSCGFGYSLSADGTTCTQIDECATNYYVCNNEGQYCNDLLGSFNCLCSSDYFSTSSGCIYAPKKFGGRIAFKLLNISSTEFLPWTNAMASTSSSLFLTTSTAIEALVITPFQKCTGFVNVEVDQLQQGSIVALFELYFGAESSINSTYLNSLFQQYLQSMSCSLNGPDCTIGDMIGVLVHSSYIYDKNLCLNSLDNFCDNQTTNCVNRNGEIFCECKVGYKRLAGSNDACIDIDECLVDPVICYANMSFCVNTVGSYLCNCDSGYLFENNTCVDVCHPNPCRNGGYCIQRQVDFFCSCQGIWSGYNCTEENSEAVLLKKVAIGLGVGLGLLCLILIVVLIVCCVRHPSTSYAVANSSADAGNYKSRRPTNITAWDNNAEAVEFQSNQKETSVDRQMSPQLKSGKSGNENVGYDATPDIHQHRNNKQQTNGEYF